MEKLKNVMFYWNPETVDQLIVRGRVVECLFQRP